MSGWQERIARDAQNYRALRDRMGKVAITETSPDGLVRVTVSADGQLTGLVLEEPWQPVPMAEVATRIMRCVATARSRIPGILQQAMAETVGTTDASAHLVLADARQKFPVPPPPQQREPRHDVVDEVRIGERSYLEDV